MYSVHIIQWHGFHDVFWKIIELAAHWDVSKRIFSRMSFFRHTSFHPSPHSSSATYIFNMIVCVFFQSKYFYYHNLFSKFHIAACNSILLFHLFLCFRHVPCRCWTIIVIFCMSNLPYKMFVLSYLAQQLLCAFQK